MLDYDAVNEGNWIGWLNVKKKLKSLVWIANEYSIRWTKRKSLFKTLLKIIRMMMM